MWPTYLKLAARSLWKNKGSTALNVVGLAAGLAVSCFVMVLLWNQWTHDDFHPGADRLYRVTSELQTEDATTRFASSSAPLAPEVREAVSGVEAATRLRRGPSTLVPPASGSAPEPGISAQTFYAEPSFFDVFGFSVEDGSARRFGEPRTAVLSRETARRLFDGRDAVGQPVVVPGVGTVQVAGVVATDRYRSHLDFDALLSLETLRQTRSAELADWNRSASAYYTYVRLAKGTSPQDVRQSLEEVRTARVEQETETARVRGFFLQAVGSIMVDDPLQNEIAQGALPTTVAYVLGALALVVLLAASFNYVNLTTARGMTRGKEVGVRKTMGARRGQVMVPFMVESVVVALLALVLGLALLGGLVPTFNQMWSVQQMGLSVDVEFGMVVYAAFVGFAVVVGLLAGWYPAWNLSRFQAAEVLQAGAQSAASEPARSSLFSWISTRKVLIVAQFALSVVVAITALVLIRQTRHMQTADYGFDDERLLMVTLNEADFEPLRNEMAAHPGVESVTGVNELPLSHALHRITVDAEPLAQGDAQATFYAASPELFDQVQMDVVAGRAGGERYREGRAVVLNELAVRDFGFDDPQSAVGRSITVHGGGTDSMRVEVVGVTADFAVTFFEGSGHPVVFRHSPDEFLHAVVRYAPDRRAEVVEAAKAAYAKQDNQNPFEARAVSEVVAQVINPFVDVGKVLVFIALIAVAIGIVGLVSMTTFSVGVRMREIGIRKALGATVPGLVYQLSSEYVWLVGLGTVIAAPLAWLLNRTWLQNLAVSVDVGVVTLAGVSLGMILLAVTTVAPQTVRAALTSPARVLRDE